MRSPFADQRVADLELLYLIEAELQTLQERKREVLARLELTQIGSLLPEEQAKQEPAKAAKILQYSAGRLG